MRNQSPRLLDLPSMHRIFVPKQHRRHHEHEPSLSRAYQSPNLQSPPPNQKLHLGPQASNSLQCSPALVRSFVTQREDSSESSYFIGRQNPEGNLDDLSDLFIKDIQFIDFTRLSYLQLKAAFQEIVSGHIQFDGIYPQSTSTLGTKLLSNGKLNMSIGLFHEMWQKVLVKSGERFQSWLYYQKYVNSIVINHSNFQSAFNECPQTDGYLNELNCDSNTNLITKRKYTPKTQEFVKEQPQLECSLEEQKVNVSQIETDEPLLNKGVKLGQGGRVRLLGQVQTNERRLNAEIVCYFLQINKVYNLEDIHISKILESGFTNKTEMVLFEGHIPKYNDQLKKTLVDYQPSLMLIMYGKVNLKHLLRLKLTYGKIVGFVTYDQTFCLSNWLKEHNFQTNSLDLSQALK